MPDSGSAAYLEVVSRWADDLAHEIKNPLHAMVINLELVKRRAGGDDPAALIQRAEIVESELHRVHDLMDSLLRLVRPWPDQPTTALNDLFGVLLPAFRARSRVRTVEYRHEGEVARVSIPPSELARVVVSLVDRALDRVPKGGLLVTAVRLEPETAEITVEHSAGRPAASDAADGPDPATSDSATPDPATSDSATSDSATSDRRPDVDGTADPAVAVARRAVEAAGGSLVLESTPTGCRATVRLPRSALQPAG